MTMTKLKHSDNFKEMIQGETDDIVSNKSTNHPITLENICQIVESNPKENLKQTKDEVQPSLGNLRKNRMHTL